jgi:hypothetical protein
VQVRRGRRKRAGRVSFACAGLILFAGCEARPPEGQVIASVDGTEITLRELAQMTGDTQLGANERQQALDAIVARKIFTMEAEKHGLQRTGEFHFALRTARETLLMEALRRDVRAELEEPDAASIDEELANRSWRYTDRFVLTLAYPGQSEPAFAIDSADLADAPSEAVLSAEPGERLIYGGKPWRVLSRDRIGADSATLRAEAAEALKTQATDSELDAMVEDYRQSGQVRFQSGWGAITEDTR